MNKNSAIKNILRRLFGNLGGNQNVNPSQVNLADEKWHTATDYSPDTINDIIKRYNLKCEKTEMVIEGERFILENWKTPEGQMLIQRVYPASDAAEISPKFVQTGTIDDSSFVIPEPAPKLENLNELLNQAIQDERYEDAAKYRDLIKNFK